MRVEMDGHSAPWSEEFKENLRKTQQDAVEKSLLLSALIVANVQLKATLRGGYDAEKIRAAIERTDEALRRIAP